MTSVDKRIVNMLKWCDHVAVKWEDGGTRKVAPVYKYNNHDCEKKGGYCHFCKPSRKRAFFCNSYVIAAYVHGYKLNDANFKKDCKKWQGGGCGGQMRRDFDPAVKKGTFEVVPGISKSKPIYTRNAAEIKAAEQILKPGDVLMIGKPGICHTAIWYGGGLITECAGDAGCATRSARFIDRGQGRRIVKVYRKTGQSGIKKPTVVGNKKTYPGIIPKLPKRGYFKLGDRMKNVEYVQKMLNWCHNYDLKVDGYYGPKTRAAVLDFQKRHGLAKDGCFGRKTLAKAKSIKK